jgi:hypothetical protein
MDASRAITLACSLGLAIGVACSESSPDGVAGALDSGHDSDCASCGAGAGYGGAGGSSFPLDGSGCPASPLENGTYSRVDMSIPAVTNTDAALPPACLTEDGTTTVTYLVDSGTAAWKWGGISGAPGEVCQYGLSYYSASSCDYTEQCGVFDDAGPPDGGLPSGAMRGIGERITAGGTGTLDRASGIFSGTVGTVGDQNCAYKFSYTPIDASAPDAAPTGDASIGDAPEGG